MEKKCKNCGDHYKPDSSDADDTKYFCSAVCEEDWFDCLIQFNNEEKPMVARLFAEDGEDSDK